MTPTNPAVIELHQLGKQYPLAQGHYQALQQINLSVQRNEYVAITGPSGSGKSTLLNILGCLDKADHGEYRLGGTSVQQMDEQQLARVRNQQIGFIFQSFHLLPRLTVLQNVLQPLLYRPLAQRERVERAMQLLHRVGLADKHAQLPNQLSGGQRQRVAIARALVTEPTLLLGDEPTGNLDSSTTAQVMALFDELHHQGHTIVLVTHEADIAQHCLRQIRLVDGQIASDLRQPPRC